MYATHCSKLLRLQQFFLWGIYSLVQMLWDPLREDPILDWKVRESLKETTIKLSAKNFSEAHQKKSLFQAVRKAWKKAQAGKK